MGRAVGASPQPGLARLAQRKPVPHFPRAPRGNVGSRYADPTYGATGLL